VAPIEVLIYAIVAAGLALACAASVRVVREREAVGRTVAQLVFVWLAPFIGPLVTMQLLRREPERDRLRETDDPGEVPGKIDQRSASYRPPRGDGTSEEAESE